MGITNKWLNPYQRSYQQLHPSTVVLFFFLILHRHPFESQVVDSLLHHRTRAEQHAHLFNHAVGIRIFRSGSFPAQAQLQRTQFTQAYDFAALQAFRHDVFQSRQHRHHVGTGHGTHLVNTFRYFTDTHLAASLRLCIILHFTAFTIGRVHTPYNRISHCFLHRSIN